MLSAQLATQIQCYLKKLKATLPGNAIPQDQALIKDAGLVQKNINGISEKGIGQNLKDALHQLAIVLPKLKDPKLRSLCIEMMAKIKPVEAKFGSGKANFSDIFTLNTFIRDRLKENFGGDCGDSTLPEGVSSSGKV